MKLLSEQEILDIAEAMVASGVELRTLRLALFQGIDPLFKSVIPYGLPDNAQVVTDLGMMNMAERLADGTVPLQIYLGNAAFLLAAVPASQQVIKKMKGLVDQRASGSPRIDITKVPETKEVIIHSDDMVPYQFMEQGLKVGSSVLKLKVPSIENGIHRKLNSGDPMYFNGTGWLISTSLVMTNHHVINARKELEAPASEEDLKKQGSGTISVFDYDSEDIEGQAQPADSLLPWDNGLDYAILRIPATDRRPLLIAPALLQLKTDSIPVNIIQHPGGKAKKYAIRNNLVSATSEKEIRYFTDTESGSSGSPVFNDQWQVVGLHKASLYAAVTNFQGKPTAFINLGTQLMAILQHLQQHYPALFEEINNNSH